MHYFFTAVFTWMLCEGIIVYFLLVKVFNSNIGEKKLLYIAIGGVFDIIYVATYIS